MRRVGVFGGTFDPPHLGHLVIAEWARVRLRLERVLFIPSGVPPHKRGRRVTATELAESMNGKLPSRNGHANSMARQQAALLARNHAQQMNNGNVSRTYRELDHDR